MTDSLLPYDPISSRSAHFADIAKALDDQRAQLVASLGPSLGASSLMSSIAEQSARQMRAFSGLQMPSVMMTTMAHSASALHSMLASMRQSTTLAIQAQQAEKLRLIDRAYANLARPAMEAARAFQEMHAAPIRAIVDSYRSQLQLQTLAFSRSASSAMAALAVRPELFLGLPAWLQRAPGAEQYAAAQAIEIVVESPRPTRDSDSEGALQAMGDEFESRLAGVDSAFLIVYRGATTALDAQGPDWRRHVSTSVRELVDHLLSTLAPDSALIAYHSGNSDAIQHGKFTHRARLQYVFRNIAVGEYERMAEEDINLTLATFYPANATVHRLVSHLTPAQVKVYLRRVQGCISTFLEAAGY